MHMTLSQAAKACGKSKGTLSKAVSNGKLSVAEKKEDGSFRIDPAELFRVFPKETETPNNEQVETHKKTLVNDREIELLERLNKDKVETIEDLRRRLDETQKRLDEAHNETRAEREKLMLWLEHKPKAPALTQEQSEPKQQQARRHWWQRKEKV